MNTADLLNLIQQKKLPHALLFCGGQLSEKREFALRVAKLLLGDKWIDDLSHPDLYYQETTAIDDVRDVITALHHAAHQGNHKVVVFALAESMPVGAMNALLKTLEEPPPQTLLILITEFPSLLSLTIRSRCQKVTFGGGRKELRDEKLEKLLHSPLSPMEQAAQLEKQPLLETLEKLYFIASDTIIKHPKPGLFKWLDEINRAREKVMRKYNPNVLLTLEALFYQWAKYGSR